MHGLTVGSNSPPAHGVAVGVPSIVAPVKAVNEDWRFYSKDPTETNGTVSKRSSLTATMSSLSLFVIPQAPKPVP